MKCQKNAGCYKEEGHSGHCYQSLGHEAEKIIQRILQSCGCHVVPASIHEDHIEKIDFWVRNGVDEYLPIQFTVDFRSALGLKGADAIKRGVIIVCLSADDLFEWERCTNQYNKQIIGNHIYQEFWEVVSKFRTTFPYLKLQRPKVLLRRFITSS
jgi:hypothetical protein